MFFVLRLFIVLIIVVGVVCQMGNNNIITSSIVATCCYGFSMILMDFYADLKNNKKMKRIINNEVTQCKNCKSHIEYTSDELKKGDETYYVYGEENKSYYTYIVCPVCNNIIKIKDLTFNEKN